jgi:predicted HTH transcriptional regulator
VPSDIAIPRILLMREFGRGFDASNLHYMRPFYQANRIRDALRHESNWTGACLRGYRRGHIEAWGRGTLKIAELLQQAGLEPFTVASEMETVTVTFRLPGKREEVSGGVSGGVNGGVNGGVGNLLAHIESHPGQKVAQIAVALGVPLRTAERWLRQLKADGKIEFRGAPKTGGYHLSK